MPRASCQGLPLFTTSPPPRPARNGAHPSGVCGTHHTSGSGHRPWQLGYTHFKAPLEAAQSKCIGRFACTPASHTRGRAVLTPLPEKASQVTFCTFKGKPGTRFPRCAARPEMPRRSCVCRQTNNPGQVGPPRPARLACPSLQRPHAGACNHRRPWSGVAAEVARRRASAGTCSTH